MARIVAELGRPETPEETAARKAEFSAAYRSSKSFRNLIAALLATLAVVLVVVFAVPRGEPAPRPAIDVSAEAVALESSLGRTVLAPAVPDDWRANSAAVEGAGVRAWTIVYALPTAPEFLRVAQGFDAGETWPAELLSGARSTGTVEIRGIEWAEYEIADPERTGNITYALATAAGADQVVLYGATTAASAAVAADGVADDIRALREESE